MLNKNPTPFLLIPLALLCLTFSNLTSAINYEKGQYTLHMGDYNRDGHQDLLLEPKRNFATVATLPVDILIEISVILDNAKYHYSEAVKEWKKNSRIHLVFLPSYSPEFNLIEQLWRVLKKNVLYNQYYETFKDFRKACVEFSANQDKHYNDISSIMDSDLEAINMDF